MPRTSLAGKLVQAAAVAAESARRGAPVEQILEERARRHLSRRSFLGRTAALGALGFSGVTMPGMLSAARSVTSPRVVVVGAGLAGLTCAYRLRQAGVTATVFDANTRLGGRCWTQRGAFADGQLAEHGGELIDQGHTTIRQLIQELGLVTDNLLQAEANGTEPFYYFGGAHYSYAEAVADLKQIWQKMHRDLSEASYPTLYNSFTPRGAALDQMSIIDWINETVPGGLNSRLGQLLDVAYNIEYGGESNTQSSLNLLYLLGYSGPGQLRLFGPSNEKYRIRGGNDSLPARLAASIGSPVQTGNSLIAVAQTPAGGYALTFESGRRTTTVTADKVILALPFSILRTSVDLSRAGFSALKHTAIREQGMGTNSKMHVQFRTRHWQTLGGNGDSYSDRGCQVTWDSSRGQAGQSGMMVNYTGGNIGASFGSGTPAQRATQFLAQIEPVMPGLTTQWNGRAAIDYWPGNAFTRGSYSFWKVGQCTKFAGVEGEQQGNCHFAGEHTSIDSQGYLNGAVESGDRAAQEVLVDLGLRPK